MLVALLAYFTQVDMLTRWLVFGLGLAFIFLGYVFGVLSYFAGFRIGNGIIQFSVVVFGTLVSAWILPRLMSRYHRARLGEIGDE